MQEKITLNNLLRLPMVSNMRCNGIVSAAPIVLLVLLLRESPALAQNTTEVLEPEFVSGSANITLANDNTYTGRTTKIALTSPDDVFELALIQDGFETDTRFQYCWTEVHDTATGTNITWRAPCNPVKVDECSLKLTSDGRFYLEVGANGAYTAAFVTDTSDQGVEDVQLTDEGDLLLVTADNDTVWQSSDHLDTQQRCTEAFFPSSASSLARFAWLGLACSISLAAIMALPS